MCRRRDAMATHAIRRLAQRKGVRLSRVAYEGLCEELASKRGVELKTGARAIPCSIKGRKVIAIWNYRHDCIVTFYPCASWIMGRTVQTIGEVRA